MAETSKTADYYIDAILKAEGNVNTYSSPEGTLKKTYTKGAIIGKIRSYITRNGFVWWELYDGTFVKHNPSMLELNTEGSGAAHELAVKELNEKANEKDLADKVLGGATDLVGGAGEALTGIGDTIKALGKNLPTILIVLGILIAIAVLAYGANAFKNLKT